MFVFDGAELQELAQAARREDSQSADALGDIVHGGGQIGILCFEHLMKTMELRTRHIPVKP